jgi:hypothetical protein
MKQFWKRLKHAFSFRPVEGVVVPQADIDKLEEARLRIWEIIGDKPIPEQVLFANSTEKMWLITHRKYPKAI